MGTPTDGHQCYKQMSVDLKFCLDAKLLDECKTKPNPIYPGQTVYNKILLQKNTDINCHYSLCQFTIRSISPFLY